jgi:hypothetical protein
MKKRIIKWALTAVSSLCIAVSVFLAADTKVFAACTIFQTCDGGASVSCSGSDGTCTSGTSGGRHVSCVNGNTRITCYCGSGCIETRIGGDEFEIEVGPEN